MGADPVGCTTWTFGLPVQADLHGGGDFSVMSHTRIDRWDVA
jgi:hypothetical protein